MAGQTQTENGWSRSRWRAAIWGMAALLLMVPLVAMQFTDEVKWGLFDFVGMGALLAGVCGTIELAARATVNKQYRAAVAIAVVAAFLLIWMNLAAGIIGDEDNPANVMFAGVLFVALLGSFSARFRPHAMARAFTMTAVVQALVGVIGLTVFNGELLPLIGLTGFFVTLWLISAELFRWAGEAESPAGAHPIGTVRR